MSNSSRSHGRTETYKIKQGEGCKQCYKNTDFRKHLIWPGGGRVGRQFHSVNIKPKGFGAQMASVVLQTSSKSLTMAKVTQLPALIAQNVHSMVILHLI